MKAFITNGEVAWEVGGRTGSFYLAGLKELRELGGFYTPWGGWKVLKKLPDGALQERCGLWRLSDAEEASKHG